MIALTQLSAALAEHISRRTGIAAYPQRLTTGVYPMYAVSLLPGEMQPHSGGDQLLRQVTARIACYPSRQRGEQEGLDMADRLTRALLPALPLCDRHFVPRDCRWQEKDNVLTLVFLLEFCDAASTEGGEG